MEENNPKLSFDEQGDGAIFRIYHARALETRNANINIDRDLKELSNTEGITKFKRERIKKGIESYKNTTDVKQLENIKTNLNSNKEVKDLFSKEEISKINKDIDSRISKIKSKEIVPSTESESTTTQSRPSAQRNRDSAIEAARRKKEERLRRGSVNTPEPVAEVTPRTDEAAEQRSDELVETVNANEAKGGNVENGNETIGSLSDLIVDDSGVLFQEDGHNPLNSIEDAGVENMAPREFNSKFEEARELMKKVAKKFSF